MFFIPANIPVPTCSLASLPLLCSRNQTKTMTDPFGTTRNVVKERYALLTAGSFVPSHLPGWEKSICHVLISPALGARFAQLLIAMDKEGQCVGNTGLNQYFLFLLEGAATVLIESRKHRLEPGSYAYLPSGQDVQIASAAPSSHLLVFQKEYQPIPGLAKPIPAIGHEREIKGQPWHGNPDMRLQALLPAHPSFDIAVNILTCQPGTALPEVQSPVMERGWRMLQGQGVFRLCDDWHPVQPCDVIWTAPYCPQWVVAVGPSPLSCIYFEDVNRDPM
jgi:(S)-ureidoglycine aminohydrolase